MNNRAKMQFLRRDKRKTFLKIKTHLVSEHRTSADTRTIGFFDAVFKDVFHKSFVLV